LAAVIQVILYQAPGHPDGPQDGRKKSGFIVSPPAISFKSNLKVNHVLPGWVSCPSWIQQLSELHRDICRSFGAGTWFGHLIPHGGGGIVMLNPCSATNPFWLQSTLPQGLLQARMCVCGCPDTAKSGFIVGDAFLAHQGYEWKDVANAAVNATRHSLASLGPLLCFRRDMRHPAGSSLFSLSPDVCRLMCHCPKRSSNKCYGFYVGHRAKPDAVDSAFDVSALIPLSCGSSCTQPHPPLRRHSSRRNANDALNQLNGSGKSQFLRQDAERSHQRPIGFIVLL
jgi:hypothetical protein